MTPDRKEREERRMKALAMFRNGTSWADIGKALGVSRTTVSKWARRVSDGDSMQARRPTGRPHVVPLDIVRRIIDTGRMPSPQKSKDWVVKPNADLAATKGWTGPALARAIQRETGVQYAVDHCYRLLKLVRTSSDAS